MMIKCELPGAALTAPAVVEPSRRLNMAKDTCSIEDDQGRYYSSDTDRYFPLCVPCHKRFDFADAKRRTGME